MPRDGGANRTWIFDDGLDGCFEEEDVTDFDDDVDCFEDKGTDKEDEGLEEETFEDDGTGGLEEDAEGFPDDDKDLDADDGFEDDDDECFLLADCFEAVDLLDCTDDTE